MKKVILLINTIKFLKPTQIIFRAYYKFRKLFRDILNIYYNLDKESHIVLIDLDKSINMHVSYLTKNKFIFLNISKQFHSTIDWNYPKHGKLWTYNLNYFEFLNQKDINKIEGLALIYDYINSLEKIKDGLEPFPLSLRIMNWIKFLCYQNVQDKKINDSLYAQCYVLYDNLEYHLLGNHLLENAFALLFGSYYFNDKKLYQKAKYLLERELSEQILEDGGHFELSPMYHQLMLFRLLDAINLLKNNQNNDFLSEKYLLDFLIRSSKKMLGWLQQVSYNNGDIPLLNDSAKGIAPHSNELFSYAKDLNIMPIKSKLSSSGYRTFKNNYYESIVDVGEIGASYLAGHAHADTFNFEVRVNGKEFIVDTGISTYQTTTDRSFQRSTKAHNTVVVKQKNSSQVWGAFRVANRANIIKLQEKGNTIIGVHNGYKSQGVLHERHFTFHEKEIIINDILSNKMPSQFHLHFHPNVSKSDIQRLLIVEQQEVNIECYDYPLAYNKLTPAYKAIINFNKELKTRIKIEKS